MCSLVSVFKRLAVWQVISEAQQSRASRVFLGNDALNFWPHFYSGSQSRFAAKEMTLTNYRGSRSARKPVQVCTFNVEAYMTKKQVSFRKRARDAKRKSWSINDQCLYCAQEGPHAVAFSHVSKFGPSYKVTCCRCKKYQKFISEKMKNEIDKQLISEQFTNPKAAS